MNSTAVQHITTVLATAPDKIATVIALEIQGTPKLGTE
jgi:hypothetical protein